jgi:hypothetical protein
MTDSLSRDSIEVNRSDEDYRKLGMAHSIEIDTNLDLGVNLVAECSLLR